MDLFWLSFFFFFFFFFFFLLCWYWFTLNNFCRDALISVKVCRRIYRCQIQVKFDIGNHPQNFSRVMAFFRHSFCCFVYIGFHSVTFCRDALFTLEVCRRIYHYKLQVKFDICNYPQNFGRIMALFRQLLLLSWYWFPLYNFCRDGLISLEVCMSL